MKKRPWLFGKRVKLKSVGSWCGWRWEFAIERLARNDGWGPGATEDWIVGAQQCLGVDGCIDGCHLQKSS